MKNYLHFIGSDKEFRCLKKSFSCLVEVYAPQLLNQASNLNDGGDLMDSGCVYVEAVTGGRPRGALDI